MERRIPCNIVEWRIRYSPIAGVLVHCGQLVRYCTGIPPSRYFVFVRLQ